MRWRWLKLASQSDNQPTKRPAKQKKTKEKTITEHYHNGRTNSNMYTHSDFFVERKKTDTHFLFMHFFGSLPFFSAIFFPTDHSACAIMCFFVYRVVGAIRLEIHGSQNVHLLGPVAAPSKHFCGDFVFFYFQLASDRICFISFFVFIESHEKIGLQNKSGLKSTLKTYRYV